MTSLHYILTCIRMCPETYGTRKTCHNEQKQLLSLRYDDISILHDVLIFTSVVLDIL